MHRASRSTRQQVLTCLKHYGSATADSLSKELGISPVAVRQHLTGLEAEGIIYTAIERRGLGRPIHRYALTAIGDETFPRDYDGLATTLLDEVRATGGDSAVEDLFVRRTGRIRAAMLPGCKDKPLSLRVAEVARIQSEYGYMAEVQEDADSLRIVQYNCAICQVARTNPAACRQELILIQDLIGDGARVERETHMMAGDHTCTYRIHAK